jgi:hypothetical protein
MTVSGMQERPADVTAPAEVASVEFGVGDHPESSCGAPVTVQVDVFDYRSMAGAAGLPSALGSLAAPPEGVTPITPERQGAAGMSLPHGSAHFHGSPVEASRRSGR